MDSERGNFSLMLALLKLLVAFLDVTVDTRGICECEHMQM